MLLIVKSHVLGSLLLAHPKDFSSILLFKIVQFFSSLLYPEAGVIFCFSLICTTAKAPKHKYGRLPCSAPLKHSLYCKRLTILIKYRTK